MTTETKADFNWNPAANAAGGTSLVGYYEPKAGWSFEETVARLKALSGQDPTAAGDGYKVSVEFVGTFRGHVFTLYDYKGDRSIHIGGKDAFRKDPQNVRVLCKELDVALRTVTPVEYAATVQYDEATGQQHGWPGVDAAGPPSIAEQQAQILEALAVRWSDNNPSRAAQVEALRAGAAALRGLHR